MAQRIVHVVFTPSGAACLCSALKGAGRDDEVVAFFDNLSFGPIDSPDASRAEWVENELGWTGWDEVASRSEPFWREALSSDHRKVAWLSRRSTMEYANFLEWLWRLGNAPSEVVDLTDVMISSRQEPGPSRRPRLAISLAMLPDDVIAREKLWDLAAPLQTGMRTSCLDLWRQLRDENAPLRIIDGGTLKSAPITFFDSLLMSHATDDWQKVTMIIGRAWLPSGTTASFRPATSCWQPASTPWSRAAGLNVGEKVRWRCDSAK
jgi:Protein of unknown function/Domain of unknown function (DUF1835)